MPRHSAGILMFRRGGGGDLEFLLAHPGGPLWAKRDDHAWTIPKGEFDPGHEEALPAAKRELAEEIGAVVMSPALPLTPIKLASGKIVHAFAVEQDFDPASLVSNTFALEWPPKSQRMQDFPEIDRAAWFAGDVARTKLLSAQIPFLDELERTLTPTGGGTPTPGAGVSSARRQRRSGR